MLPRHNPDERQSQADAARVVRARVQGAPEVLEPLGLLLGCDAGALIRDAQGSFGGAARQLQGHGALGWRVLDRIAQQVHQRPPQLCRSPRIGAGRCDTG
jgi:hypothetical protein